MKSIYLSLFLLFTGPLLYGQAFMFGVKGGIQGYKLSFADKDLKEVFKSKPQGGYSGGVTLSFPLPDNFSFVVDAGYSKKGRRVLLNSDEWVNKSTYYFMEGSWMIRKSFPIHAYDFPAHWYVNAGLNLNYWLGGKGKIITAGPGLEYEIQFADSAGTTIETMYMVDANRWMYGLDFGAGFMAQATPRSKFLAEMRFTYGQTYLGESDSANLYILGFDDNLKNAFRTINISFGYVYMFDLKNLKKGKSTLDKKQRRDP